MKRYFCTYFDINFSPRGMALYDSIKGNCGDFTLFVLALDDKVTDRLKDYPNVVVISIEEYFSRHNVDVTKYETKKELYFSLTAGYCLFILEKYPEIDILFYVDADIYFFDSVEYLFTEMEGNSIYLTSHKVMPILEKIMGYYGLFNVGINGFRNDEIGIASLKKWKEDCDCWNRNLSTSEGSFFSDQLYLDKWPQIFTNVCVSNNPGVNLAPWSIGQYKIYFRNTRFYVDGHSVVAFHFSDLKRLEPSIWDTNSGPHLFFLRSTKRKLYKTYLVNVEKYYNAVETTDKYVTLNHRRSSFKRSIRSLLNHLTGSIINCNR